jgi:type VI secretion system protein ImpF
MPIEPEVTVQPPLLDRLIDTDPGSSVEPPQSRSGAVRALKEALRRDLEWLLNTRRTPVEIPTSFTELRSSVFNFGMPDLTSFSPNSADDEAFLLESLEAAISRFEPRLKQVRIVITKSLGKLERTLHFHVEALLMVDPAPEAVSFDTVFRVDQGKCEVNG